MARALLAVCLGVCLAQIRVLAPNSLVERLPSAGRIIGTTAIFGVRCCVDRAGWVALAFELHAGRPLDVPEVSDVV